VGITPSSFPRPEVSNRARTVQIAFAVSAALASIHRVARVGWPGGEDDEDPITGKKKILVFAGGYHGGVFYFRGKGSRVNWVQSVGSWRAG